MEASQHGTWAMAVLITPPRQHFCGAGWLTETTASVATACRWATSALQGSFCKATLGHRAACGCRRHPKTKRCLGDTAFFLSLLAPGKKSFLSITPKTGGPCWCPRRGEHHATPDGEERVLAARPGGEQHKEAFQLEGGGKIRDGDGRMCRMVLTHPAARPGRADQRGGEGAAAISLALWCR